MNIQQIIRDINNINPLIHCITNQVTINNCANILLGLGASPIMADNPQESAEITSSSSALVLNMGMLSELKFQAMLLSAEAAFTNNIPVVLDPVGVNTSSYRLEKINQLLQTNSVTLIRGNYSEILKLSQMEIASNGVDSTDSLLSYDIKNILLNLSSTLKAKIVMTGKIDYLCDGNSVLTVKNGSSDMKRITGMGCMLSAFISAFLGAYRDISLENIAQAVAIYEVCGEDALKRSVLNNGGTATALTYFIDNISKLYSLDISTFGGLLIEKI